MSGESPKLSALVVDDEIHGRDVVKHMLKAHADITVVGEAANGAQALQEIRAKRPDIVFLDIRMPKRTGLELADALATDTPPVIVFVTAHDGYAVQAFERSAFDYLLKPFDQERFDQTMERARARLRADRDANFGRRLRELFIEGTGSSSTPPSFPPATAAEPGRLARFVVKDAGRVFFIPVDATDWLEASGNYVGLHVGGKTHLIHETLRVIERSLDPKKFLRIHRSTIVNVDRIKELQPFANGEFVVILHDGTRLKLSRSFRERANAALGLR
ncbi:MAG TPA: response regulator [Opitutaceae bacterium]